MLLSDTRPWRYLQSDPLSTFLSFLGMTAATSILSPETPFSSVSEYVTNSTSMQPHTDCTYDVLSQWSRWKSRKRKWNGNRKWKLEMEIGNGNGNKKRTNHWCNVVFLVCLVITLVFYLVIVMGLALWVMLCLYSCTTWWLLLLVWLSSAHVASSVAM